ncbi:V-type ATP synthase subunit D [Aerococcaceae bacterium DSM 111176]|nr:V-type ATP synthase subunit D [Aerococcaceae bacterium DSM 111176]
MAILNVNPTRMELARLKERLALASRGHDILKDKHDGLMRYFIDLARENNQYRQEVEALMKKEMQTFALAKAFVHEEYLDQIAIGQGEDTIVKVKPENMMSVHVPTMQFTSKSDSGEITEPLRYGYIYSNADLDEALVSYQELLPKMLKLAELEKKTQLLANEIERTRRRVNSLKESTIPDLEDTIKMIQMKLSENERAEITRLMKIKDFDQEEDEFEEE